MGREGEGERGRKRGREGGKGKEITNSFETEDERRFNLSINAFLLMPQAMRTHVIHESVQRASMLALLSLSVVPGIRVVSRAGRRVITETR